MMISGQTAVDRLYRHEKQVEDFRFDHEVTAVFADMIERSVPGYRDMLEGISCLARDYYIPRSRVYDLGCSLGAASLSMLKKIDQEGLELIAVDLSESMVREAKHNLDVHGFRAFVRCVQGDIGQMVLERASVVVLHLTLQFILPSRAPCTEATRVEGLSGAQGSTDEKQPDLTQGSLNRVRQHLVNRIYRSLLPGGILIVSEKVCFDEEDTRDFFSCQHRNFKQRQGYSDLEVIQKRLALEKVMKPDTIPTHLTRFRTAGFKKAFIWYQNLNFCSFIAFKPLV